MTARRRLARYTGAECADFATRGSGGWRGKDVGRLLLRCADRPGLVAAVSAFLAGAGANIVSLDQHSTEQSGGTFMQRTIFNLPGLTAARDALERDFREQVASGFDMDFRLTEAAKFRRLGQPEIHIEPRGHLLTEISFESVARGRQPGQVEYGPLHERAPGLLGGVLIQRHDVGAGAGEKRTYRGHQSWSIGTTQQEPTNILAPPPPATCARVLLLHPLQGVTPGCLGSPNLHILRRCTGPSGAAQS